MKGKRWGLSFSAACVGLEKRSRKSLMKKGRKRRKRLGDWKEKQWRFSFPVAYVEMERA